MIPALKEAPNADLVALASRNPSTAEVVAARYGVPRVHEDYASLLADPNVEAVYLPLPPSDHVDWTVRAAEAGKHVLVEKPLTIDPSRVSEVEEAAAASEVRVLEGFMYRFHPQQTRVRELISEGAIGEVRVVRTAFAYPVGSHEDNIRLDRSLGGGATWDVGPYAVNVPRLLFGGEPLTAYAETTSRPGQQVETSVAGILDFGEGRRAVLDYSMDYGPRAFYEVQGTEGTLAIDNAWQMPGEAAQIYLRRGDEVVAERLRAADHFRIQMEVFSERVLDGGPLPYSLEDARNNARASAALLASAEQGRRVALADVPAKA
jgi:predicted dehydrogenase